MERVRVAVGAAHRFGDAAALFAAAVASIWVVGANTASASLNTESTGAFSGRVHQIGSYDDSEATAACLLGSWVHSHEEDREGIAVYRQEGYPFPPARGRDGYEFLAGGSLVYHGIGPADGPIRASGRWELLSPTQIEITIDAPNGPTTVEPYRIVACRADLLALAR